MKANKLFFGFLFTCLTLPAAAVWAAPVPVTDDLNELNSAYGVMLGTDSNRYYIENKVSDTLILGLQSTSWQKAASTTDLFGQIQGLDGTDVLIGIRNFDSKTKGFIGVTKTMPTSLDWNTYVTAVVGKEFQEVEAGAIYTVTQDTDINLSYNLYRYHGNHSSVNIGLTYKAW